MPFQIIRQDITRMKVDAIVNAANPSLLGGGGVDGAIHRAAGRQLLEECRTLNGCETGEAKMTKGYLLPAKYVIHTVGPIWHGGEEGEEALLRSCYRNSLELAAEHQLESIAFPLISAGVYGYPKAQAVQVAVDEIDVFLKNHDMMVYLVVYGKDAFRVSQELYGEVQAFIDKVYEPSRREDELRRRENEVQRRQSEKGYGRQPSDGDVLYGKSKGMEALRRKKHAIPQKYTEAPIRPMDRERGSIPEEILQAPCMAPELDEMLNQIDESFSRTLLRRIDEKGMTDAECYHNANVDRRLFNKIKNNEGYRPGKRTALAFAIALKLDLNETRDLLLKAGFALSHSDKMDVIVEYFIINRNYNINTINETLFDYDQPLLGSN